MILTCLYTFLQETEKIDRSSTDQRLSVLCSYENIRNTVVPRLTSDPANEFFRLTNIFRCFWTRLTNMDLANECFSGCAR
jgi:hypothetical protein